MAEPRRDDFPNNFVGDLVHTERGWVVVPPTACPDGHAWVNRLALRIRSLGTPVCGDYWDWGWSSTLMSYLTLPPWTPVTVAVTPNFVVPSVSWHRSVAPTVALRLSGQVTESGLCPTC